MPSPQMGPEGDMGVMPSPKSKQKGTWVTFTPPDRDRRGPGVASSPLPGLGTDWGGLGPCPQGPSHLQVLKLLLLLLEHLKLLQHRVLRELPPLQLPKDTAGTGGCVAARCHPLSPPQCSVLPSPATQRYHPPVTLRDMPKAVLAGGVRDEWLPKSRIISRVKNCIPPSFLGLKRPK